MRRWVLEGIRCITIFFGCIIFEVLRVFFCLQVGKRVDEERA